MTLGADLEGEVKEVSRAGWSIRDGNVVPSDESVGLGNDGVRIDATVLYADLADPTDLVDSRSDRFAAETYKVFLRCAARVIRGEGGAITAYNGVRIMAVFIGDHKNSTAARTALKINHAVKKIVQPALEAQYARSGFRLKHVVGIDTSKLDVARTGIRGANDLVWVGRAANHAAKLSSMDDGFATWITKAVCDWLHERSKLSGGVDMWEKRLWTAVGNAVIYRSNYRYAL